MPLHPYLKVSMTEFEYYDSKAKKIIFRLMDKKNDSVDISMYYNKNLQEMRFSLRMGDISNRVNELPFIQLVFCVYYLQSLYGKNLASLKLSYPGISIISLHIKSALQEIKKCDLVNENVLFHELKKLERHLNGLFKEY
jgi:hypothetical protein